MKAKNILGTAALGLAFLTAAHADVTIEITGASAFRKAALAAIKTLYTNDPSASFKFAHDKTSGNLTSSTRAIFQGKFPGVTGVTTIRTNFTGSVEGIRALTISGNYNVTYLATSVFGAATNSPTGTEVASAATTDSATAAEFAFSDVSKDSTPLASYSNIDGGAVGVVAFTMIANEGAPTNLTNVSSKQFQALFSGGSQPASLFTGNSSDTTKVYATGRNDGSGTRTTYMAETGLGITTLVNQFVTNSNGNFTSSAGAGSILRIYKVPAQGNGNGTLTNRAGYVASGNMTGGSASDASTVWGQNLAGNGGYNSGSTLVTHLGYTSNNTEVLEADGTTLEAAGPIALVSFLSTADAITAKAGGAVILGYNGVKLDGIAGGAEALSASDKEKITEGAYTAWSYQQLYKRTDITSGDTFSVWTALNGAIPAAIDSTSSGVKMDDMVAGRTYDGGPVAP